MGSPLDPTFSNYYVSNLEDNVFKDSMKPIIYVPYVDSIFLAAKSLEKQTMNSISVIDFFFSRYTNKLR